MTALEDFEIETGPVGRIEPADVFAIGSRRWGPNCAKCGKAVEHAEIIGGTPAVKQYQVRCHGAEEKRLVGVWAAFEYARKGKGLPDSFTTNL